MAPTTPDERRREAYRKALFPNQPSPFVRKFLKGIVNFLGLPGKFFKGPPRPGEASKLTEAPKIQSIQPVRLEIDLIKRQSNQFLPIPATYANQDNSPQPGTVAGIVLGVVAGVLLILWLLYTVFNAGGGPSGGASEVEVVRRPSASQRRSRRSETRSEVIEVRENRARTPPPRRHREQIIVEETRRQSMPPPMEREDDIVEVIEEHSPPPRRSRRGSGYRNVEPDEFAGGRRSMRHVR
jgi:hypothetical protein